ncbi:MAG: HAD-IC family P-type ATPase, partial [Clostridia bacterium]|nr:HAD-IC family P-type ATPase [Clostridia bacterium]
MSANYQGLTEVQAQKLLAEQGKNFHSRKKRSTFLQKFLMQFSDLMIVILLISAAISFAMALFSHQKGELTEPIIIVVIVIANALLGAIQEHRAEKSLDALAKLASPKTKVVRDGVVRLVESALVVVDDVCIFESGDVVTADCVLLESNGLFVNQAALTGESMPQEKMHNCSTDDKNKIFSSSFVTKGSCVAKVFATGPNTEIGKIAGMLSQSKQQLTPLQHKLKQLSKVIGIVCLAVCGAVLVLGFVKGVANRQAGQTLTDVFLNVLLTSISLAVAAIPEGLP